MHDTEDKNWWVIEGRRKEDIFVQEVAPQLKINAIINPDKKTNPYGPDLIVDGAIADLKCQETPFFKSYSLYRIPNQYAVTFNYKDYINYRKNYPNIVLFFWIYWKELEKIVGSVTYTVKPMSGIWKVNFNKLLGWIETGKVPLHQYLRRVNDSAGNAKDSYIFDIRKFDELLLNLKN